MNYTVAHNIHMNYTVAHNIHMNYTVAQNIHMKRHQDYNYVNRSHKWMETLWGIKLLDCINTVLGSKVAADGGCERDVHSNKYE